MTNNSMKALLLAESRLTNHRVGSSLDDATCHTVAVILAMLVGWKVDYMIIL